MRLNALARHVKVIQSAGHSMDIVEPQQIIVMTSPRGRVHVKIHSRALVSLAKALRNAAHSMDIVAQQMVIATLSPRGHRHAPLPLQPRQPLRLQVEALGTKASCRCGRQMLTSPCLSVASSHLRWVA